MDGRINFDINESLKVYLSDPNAIPTPEASATLTDCENDPENFSANLVNSVLDLIVDAIADNPENVVQSSHFDSLQFLLKSSSFLPPSSLSKLLDILVSGISAYADIVHSDSAADEAETVQHHKQILEAYGFLLQWAIAGVETKAAEKSASTSAAAIRGRGGKGGKPKKADGAWDASPQVQSALDTMSKILKLRLSRIFGTTSERDTFVNLFTRAVYLVQESEARMKNMAIRMHSFKVLCIAIKHHGHAYGAQTSIIQNLSYFEHLSEPMAEFLHILAEQYDYTQLAEEILRELSGKEFNSNDLKGPKSVSVFIAKLSELAPRLVIRQMTSLAKFLDSESYTLRCAIIEVCGNLVAMLSKQEASEQAENHKAQMNAFFDVLEERFLDMNPYCRCRVMQVYMKICDLETKFPKRRQKATELAVRSLEDKSSNVRRNAVKLLAKFISTHPFSVLHGGQLAFKDWSARLDAVEAELNALKPVQGTPGLGEKQGEPDVGLVDDATEIEGAEEREPEPMSEKQKQQAMQKAAEDAVTSEAISKLQLTRRYYVEAIRFIEAIHEASPIICQLLLAKNKSEVIEAMDFFMIADAYKIETARTGIRKMLHLIWTKGNSDEGKGVQTHLIECYRSIFFDAPDNFSANDAANYVARNMISLTFGASLAELTSLEQLLGSMMKGELIPELVIAKLWQVYSVQHHNVSRSQRRGAIVILSMLATADPNIVVREIESLLLIGLGSYGQSDLALARHSCVALARIKPRGRKGKQGPSFARLPNDHAVMTKLASMIGMASDDMEWYPMAEQAIGAIYGLSKHPDVLCSDIIRNRTKEVFAGGSQASAEDQRDDMAIDNDETGNTESSAPESRKPQLQKPEMALAQLLFIVGHVAIKQIVHLELCELDFKKRKAERSDKQEQVEAPSNDGGSPSKKERGKKTSQVPDESAQKEEISADKELDLIGGTTEDDFTDALNHIREREILYGSTALLSSFGPLAAEICANPDRYPDSHLQATTTLAMAKLMCVSSEYCEQHIGLLLTALERSPDARIRGNACVALGDMAVCFSTLLDDDTAALYRRLSDSDVRVKRTCLMTLTFLILAGQIKVKGQLAAMAKCLEDPDRQVAELSRMFFTELAGKDNAVYNQFVDMFSMLSAESCAADDSDTTSLSEDQFRRILRFLCGFVEKDRHAKQLAQKLAARLPRCTTQRQWNDVAFVLGVLPHKDEEISQVLTQGFGVVQSGEQDTTPVEASVAQVEVEA